MESDQRIRKSNFLKVLYLGFCNMTLFICYSAGQNLMTSLYDQLGYGNLGQINFFMIYIGVATASLVSTYYYKKVPTKTGLLLGAFVHINLVIAGAIATYCKLYNSDTMVCQPGFIYIWNLGSGFSLGFGAAFFWLYQGVYINACADESVRGTFNGVASAILTISGILSSSIATFALGRTDKFTFYCILLIFGGLSMVMFAFVRPPLPYSEVKEKTEELVQETLTESIQSFLKALRTQKYLFLFIVIAFSGAAISFYCTYLGIAVKSTILSEDEKIINQNTAFVFILLSLGGVTAGLSIGKLADKYNKITILGLTMIILEIALVATLIAMLFGNYKVSMFAGVLWGYGDTSINTMINVVIGSRFNASPEIFSAYRFLSAIGCMFTTTVGILIAKSAPTFYIIIVAASLLALHNFYFKHVPHDNNSTQKLLQTQEEKVMLEMKNL